MIPMKTTFKFLFIALLMNVFFVPVTKAQLNDEEIKQIDELFQSWNTPDHPGGSAGVVVNDKLVYAKAFGLASLEYLTPNTFGTQYNIASVSKQFTAFGITLMHVRGQLSVDDDIRKYLPELPEFDHTVTIRHLLHHTSGLRSLHTMLALAGWRGDDSRTNADLLRLMINQKDLNFVPGSEYMYCNTGYMFMSEIIERISGVEFSEWMKQEIFDPMGLNNTYVEEFYNRVVKNNATSYSAKRDGGFNRSVEYWGYVGSGNIHTNVQDLLTWLKQVRNPEPKWKEAMLLMRTTDPFNDGSHNKYAFGVNVEKYKGENRIQHGGSIGGFRSIAVTYPKRKTDIVILTNFSASNPGGKANQIADIIMDKKPAERQGPKAYRLSLDKFDKISGRYSLINHPAKSIDIFRIGNGFYAAEKGKDRFRITAISETEFTNNNGDVKITIGKDQGIGSKIIEYKNDQSYYNGTFLKSFENDQQETKKLIGSYWSPELETQYKLVLKEGELKGYHTRHGWFDIRKVRDNEFNGSPSYFNFFKVKEDKRGRVLGIYVTNSRVRNLWLEKTN